MNQLDRIEAKLDLILERLHIENNLHKPGDSISVVVPTANDVGGGGGGPGSDGG